MAFLYISEYADLSVGRAGKVGQVAFAPPLVEQAIVNTGGNAQSAAFNSATRYVRLGNDSSNAVAIKFGLNPTAVASGASGTARMAANQTEYFGVPMGQSFKVAVIATS
jgi:hypothetical protein